MWFCYGQLPSLPSQDVNSPTGYNGCSRVAYPISRDNPSSPKIGDMLQRKKLSAAEDKAVDMARRLDSRATLKRETAEYFKSRDSAVAAEEADLENVLSAASQEMDFDQP
jgi:hypothetical protein